MLRSADLLMGNSQKDVHSGFVQGPLERATVQAETVSRSGTSFSVWDLAVWPESQAGAEAI